MRWASEERYSRNSPAISGEEQQKLADSNVLLAGCGGIGGYTLELLARIGVGHITVVDKGRFQGTDLNRQLLSNMNVLESDKVAVAKDRVEMVNPLVSVTPLQTHLDSANSVSLVSGFGCVADALDNLDSRSTLARACGEAGVPLVHAAICGWGGRWCDIFPGDKLVDFLYQPVEYVQPTGMFGCTAPAAACAASLQAAEVVKILLGKPVAHNVLHEFNLMDGTTREYRV